MIYEIFSYRTNESTWILIVGDKADRYTELLAQDRTGTGVVDASELGLDLDEPVYGMEFLNC